MRCYHFGNFYMSSIQQGIQAAHAQMELFTKYQPIDSRYFDTHFHTTEERVVYEEAVDMLYDWAQNHKTMVCLNGGANIDLQRIEGVMEMEGNPYPWSTFHEEPGAVSHIETLTNIAIVLPERIYETSRYWNKYINSSLYSVDWNSEGGCVIEHANQSKDAFICELSPFETQLVDTLSQCRLAG